MLDEKLGTLFIVAAPSGGGKTSLVRQVVTQLAGIEISISHTTRQPRPMEKNGVDYFFIDAAQFAHMVQQGKFLEHAQVYDHFYGTSIEQIQTRLHAGVDVILDIDWQGARQIKQIFSNAVSIFILPPSLEVLEERLSNRQQDNENVIQYRMAAARDELSHYQEFDYLMVNENFQKATEDLIAIVTAERLKTKHQMIWQRKLLSFLCMSQ